MSFDLLSSKIDWIPWRRRSGTVEWGPISLLTERIGHDPIIAIAAPRPDFESTLYEFLIGLLSFAIQPADESEWQKSWHKPPTPAEVQQALALLPSGAFDLDADDGPRFLQDFSASDLAQQEVLPIDRLAIDSPGEQGIKNNTTLFVKPERFETVCRAVAAMAIIAMQTYAPAGGSGVRTSMRGGGPLTTLIDPRQRDGQFSPDQQPLWFMLWINVETLAQLALRANPANDTGSTNVEDVMPWFDATRTSAGNEVVTPEGAHPLQAYFGMPRRIRLEFGGEGTCDLTGKHDARCVTGFRARNYGVNYAAWMHPLSPYYRSKLDWLPVHPQPGGLTWRDWPGVLLKDSNADRAPAEVVLQARRRMNALRINSSRLIAFGYDLDNMKARGWLSVRQPAFALRSSDDDITLAFVAKQISEATYNAAFALTLAIKRVWFESEESASGEIIVPRQQLWQETESAFFFAIREAINGGLTLEAHSNARRSFMPSLRRTVMDIFDDHCPIGSVNIVALRRYTGALHSLRGTMNGYGKTGEAIYNALTLPLPEKPASKKPATNKSKVRK